jgi:hypothetical protein
LLKCDSSKLSLIIVGFKLTKENEYNISSLSNAFCKEMSLDPYLEDFLAFHIIEALKNWIKG